MIVSKRSKKEISKKQHERVVEPPCGIVWREENTEEPTAEKIILLGKENLEKLRGYKAPRPMA